MVVSVENRARVLFGLVVLLAAVAGFAWYFLAASRYATFEVRTGDLVSGLIADAPVEFHGVEVGKVKRVELVNPHFVSILLSVRRDAPVTTATVATLTARGLATRGFTGYVSVDLENVATDSRPLLPLPGYQFPQIPAAPSRSMTLDTTISEVKQDVQQLTDLLHAVLDQKTVASLKESLEDLQNLMQTLTAHSGRLDAIIRSAETASANAEAASRQIRPLLQSSQEAVETLKSETIPQADDTLLKLHELSASLKELTAEIERDPSVLVRGKGPPPPGPGEKQ